MGWVLGPWVITYMGSKLDPFINWNLNWALDPDPFMDWNTKQVPYPIVYKLRPPKKFENRTSIRITTRSMAQLNTKNFNYYY